MIDTQEPQLFKRLYFDIETSPNVVFSWNIGYNLNIGHENIIKERAIICICYKWEHEDIVRSLSWNKGDDKEMLEAFAKVINEADEVLGHNSSEYDVKWLRTRCLLYDIPLIPDINSLDTLKVARKYFRFNSNKLDYIGQFLGEGQKINHGGFNLWKRIVMDNEEEAMSEMIAYCITPDHKLLKDDLRWYKAENLKEGDIVLGFDEGGTRKKFRKAVIEKIAYDDQEVFEVRLSSGKIFKVTKEHKWLVRNGNTYKWLRTDQLITNDKKYCSRITKVMEVWEEDFSKKAGYLSGIFDGEGCLSFRGESKAITSLTIAQNPGIVLDKIQELLKDYAFTTQKTTKRGSKCQTLNLYGHKCEKLKFLGTIRPERLIKKVNFDNLGAFESRLDDETFESIKSIGIQKIIKIQTSTGTFICDGYAHHNCQQDVLLLEKIYNRISPYILHKTHRALYEDGNICDCPECSSSKTISNGTRITSSGIIKRRLQCMECGKYFSINESAYKKVKDGIFEPEEQED